jgi:hypothetical protein
MKGSDRRTGEEAIGKLNKEMLLECYTTDDVRQDYENLRKRLNDPNTDNKEFASLLRMVWEFTMMKPPKATDITSHGEQITAGIFIQPPDEDEEEIPTT